MWPSGSPMVYLHSPIVFQSLIVLSRAPDTICIGELPRQQCCPLPLARPSACEALVIFKSKGSNSHCSINVVRYWWSRE